MKVHRKNFASSTKLKPFHSNPSKIKGQATCVVIFGSNVVAVKWYNTASDCKSILAGKHTTILRINEFNDKQSILEPINMIDNDLQCQTQPCVSEYLNNSKGKGKLRNHQVKSHANTEAKTVARPPFNTIPIF